MGTYGSGHWVSENSDLRSGSQTGNAGLDRIRAGPEQDRVKRYRIL